MGDPQWEQKAPLAVCWRQEAHTTMIGTAGAMAGGKAGGAGTRAAPQEWQKRCDAPTAERQAVHSHECSSGAAQNGQQPLGPEWIVRHFVQMRVTFQSR